MEQVTAVHQRWAPSQFSVLKSHIYNLISQTHAIQDVPQGHPESLIKADLQSAGEIAGLQIPIYL
ncbi:hypothetical protein [Sphingobacterium hungaricum]